MKMVRQSWMTTLYILTWLILNMVLLSEAQGSRLWSQMSNLERRKRIDELKERLFFEIKDKGLGGGGSNYGAPDIPSYNAPAPTQQPPSYNAPAQQPPSYGAPSIPSYGQFDGFNFNKGPGKIIEIPVPDLPIPDPIEFKAGVLRSKGRIASGLLHTKAGLLRAGANILAQKANALDKFAQAIPAIKANLINSLQGFGKGGGGGGYGAPPAPSYNAPAPQQPPPSYNNPSQVQIPAQQPPQTYNNNNNNVRPSTFTSNNIQPISQTFRPSNGDSYGSPVGGVITNTDSLSANVPVGSSLSFGSNSGVDPGLGPRLNPTSSQISAAGFNPITQSTFDQAGNSLPKRNVPGQRTTITINDLQQLRQNNEQLVLRETRQQGLCKSDLVLNDLLQDIFMGNELIPDVMDRPPRYPLDLTYKTIRTFPGMRLTADMTRFKPMLKWPAQPDSLYTVVMSNLDINSRRNRTLSEFWHWFVANIPGDSLDDGDVIFELLFPLVLPEGDGDHRYGYFVFEQPGQLNYQDEGGPTDSCSPQMSNGRGPFKSTKNFMKKYNLDLTAATFLILDSNEASMEIACEWQKCIGNTINLVSPLQCG